MPFWTPLPRDVHDALASALAPMDEVQRAELTYNLVRAVYDHAKHYSTAATDIHNELSRLGQISDLANTWMVDAASLDAFPVTTNDPGTTNR